MIKYSANIISFSRIILAASLFWFINDPKVFLIIYSIAWFTDAIDGGVAKLTKSQSEFGSKIDDLADTTLISCMGIIMIIWLGKEFIQFIPFVIIFLAIRILNLMITKHKYGKTCIIHTYSAKALGLLVLLMPIVYLLTDSVIVMYVVVIAAIFVSLEETLIHSTSEQYDPDNKSYFIKRKP